MPNPSPSHLDRRGFLAAGGALLASASLAPGAGAPPPIRVRRIGRGATRNVVLLISDGMSSGALALANHYSRLRFGRDSRWIRWLREPNTRRALAETEAANTPVTDSAAAASACGIGERVNNGAVSVTPDGRAPAPLLVRAKRAGLATGLVTTTRVTHATPAAFIANVAKRADEDAIARQILDRGVDVLLGGGAKHFPPSLLDPSNIRATDAESLRRAALDEIDAPLIGIFNDSHMRYEMDRDNGEPSLAEMTDAALRALARRDNGFVVMIEGGRVDHAGHANDPCALITDQHAFDDALGVALDFAANRPADDTLVIATTDHGNADPGLIGYERAPEMFRRVLDARRSFEWITQRMAALPERERTGDALAPLVREAVGVQLEDVEIHTLDRWLRGERVDPAHTRNLEKAPLGSVLTNHLGVAFNSTAHTSDMVELTASGPGSERFPPVCHLTDAHDVVCQALSLAAAR